MQRKPHYLYHNFFLQISLNGKFAYFGTDYELSFMKFAEHFLLTHSLSSLLRKSGLGISHFFFFFFSFFIIFPFLSFSFSLFFFFFSYFLFFCFLFSFSFFLVAHGFGTERARLVDAACRGASLLFFFFLFPFFHFVFLIFLLSFFFISFFLVAYGFEI